MSEPMYLWEITIPMKIEHILWQALILVGVDIYDEYTVQVSDYTVMRKGEFNGLYADVYVAATDLEITALFHKLEELNAYATDCWMFDEICEESYEEEICTESNE